MADPVFIAIAVLTIGTAIIALEARELIYGAISLAISMLGIAGLFPFIRRAIRGNVPNSRLCWRRCRHLLYSQSCW